MTSRVRVILVSTILALSVLAGDKSLGAPSTGSQDETRAPIFREKDSQGKANNHGSPWASERLMRDLKDLRQSDSCKQGLVDVELVKDNLYEWNVKLFFPDENSTLHKNLTALKESGKGEDHIMLRVTFKDNFPFSPPFVRVVYPAMERSPSSIIFQGGAICTEILTEQGWRSVYTMESVFVVLNAVLTQYDERVAADQRGVGNYTEKVARANYNFIEKVHSTKGW